MKGYRFYEEFSSNAAKRKRVSRGAVVAVLLDERGRPFYGPNGMVDAIAGVIECEISSPASTTVSLDYLREKCRRVTEQRVREIHPRLIAWLDEAP